MYGDRISTHRNTTNIILIKSTVTYLYEKKVLSSTRVATNTLQGRLYVYGIGAGRGGEAFFSENKKIKKEKQIKYNKSI